MRLPATPVLLVTIALAVAGCGKSAVWTANAGTAAGAVPAPAVRHDLAAAGTPADAPLSVGETRGSLLYSTHCAVCHTSEIHWREKKLATDLDSLKFQVRRWQSILGLDWTESEIADVVRYLNAAFYGFMDAGQNDLPEKEKPI